MPIWNLIYFQNGVSSVIEYLIFFHDYTIMIIIMIIVVVGYILFISCLSKLYNLIVFEGQELESIWTILPAVFLLFIAFPSLHVLYLIEEFEDYDITIKAMGHQWYWSYEYRDLNVNIFDSYILREEGVNRLLDVSNRLMVPCNTYIRIIISSIDVIHSWTIPSLGVRIDAIPGRLNSLCYEFNRVGIFRGQCSEICGSNHRFIPILIIVVPKFHFLDKWIV